MTIFAENLTTDYRCETCGGHVIGEYNDTVYCPLHPDATVLSVKVTEYTGVQGLITLLRAFDCDTLFDDGATTWTADNLIDAVVAGDAVSDDPTVFRYRLTSRGIAAINPDDTDALVYRFVDTALSAGAILGSSKSKAKRAAARENGKKGGRPVNKFNDGNLQFRNEGLITLNGRDCRQWSVWEAGTSAIGEDQYTRRATIYTARNASQGEIVEEYLTQE